PSRALVVSARREPRALALPRDPRSAGALAHALAAARDRAAVGLPAGLRVQRVAAVVPRARAPAARDRPARQLHGAPPRTPADPALGPVRVHDGRARAAPRRGPERGPLLDRGVPLPR